LKYRNIAIQLKFECNLKDTKIQMHESSNAWNACIVFLLLAFVMLKCLMQLYCHAPKCISQIHRYLCRCASISFSKLFLLLVGKNLRLIFGLGDTHTLKFKCICICIRICMCVSFARCVCFRVSQNVFFFFFLFGVIWLWQTCGLSLELLIIIITANHESCFSCLSVCVDVCGCVCICVCLYLIHEKDNNWLTN